ncbi:hypothetical protein [Streptomyces sp. NRRL S-1813]|uniref:hypothetical protein n=1 Tax=Streptomyces sp. NRRL S-1813 TaxID=1463888 RepID=UPI00099DA9B6|nr:hypothetical protein [Streptomyces sp. NRRL S-1813]
MPASPPEREREKCSSSPLGPATAGRPCGQVPVPTEPDPDGLARAVADGLGVPRGKVTAEDLPDGDQTVG